MKYKNLLSIIYSKTIVKFGYKYDKSIIPDGPYCYLPDFEKNENKDENDHKYYIKTCQYYKWINSEWRGCKYLGMITDDDVFADKCKMCNENNE